MNLLPFLVSNSQYEKLSYGLTSKSCNSTSVSVIFVLLNDRIDELGFSLQVIFWRGIIWLISSILSRIYIDHCFSTYLFLVVTFDYYNLFTRKANVAYKKTEKVFELIVDIELGA